MKLDRPQLSAKWWSSVRPEGLDDKKILEKALSKTEKALAKQARKPDDERSAENALVSLKTLSKVLAKALRQTNRSGHRDATQGLDGLQQLIDDERDRLESQRQRIAEDDDDDNEGKLFEPSYAHKQAKKMKAGSELSFAFGLDTSVPEACDLLLHRKKTPERLYKILKKTKRFPNRLMCYGKAVKDPDDKQTLLFKLSASSRVPPQRIIRAARQFFQSDRKLRFRKLRIAGLPSESPSRASADAPPAEPPIS